MEHKRWVVRSGDRYYRDTRDEVDRGGFSNLFVSTTLKDYATKFYSKEEAEAWAKMFLKDFSYEIIGA